MTFSNEYSVNAFFSLEAVSATELKNAQKSTKTIITSVGEIPYKYLSIDEMLVEESICTAITKRVVTLFTVYVCPPQTKQFISLLLFSLLFDQCFHFESVFCVPLQWSDSGITNGLIHQLLFDKLMCQFWAPFLLP